MSIEPVRIINIPSERLEVHVMGNYVCVCWGFTSVRDAAGLRLVKRDYCYIDFCLVRETSSGEYYLDEDNPMEGGINSAIALEVIEELKKATEYIKENNFKES